MLLTQSLTEHVIALAIEGHRRARPGLLEPFDEQCLRVALRLDAIAIAGPT